MQHHSWCTHHSLVLPLHDPILLWVMRRYEVSSNSFFVAEVLEFVRDVFSTIISPKSLHLLPRLFLHQCLKLIELMIQNGFSLASKSKSSNADENRIKLKCSSTGFQQCVKPSLYEEVVASQSLWQIRAKWQKVKVKVNSQQSSQRSRWCQQDTCHLGNTHMSKVMSADQWRVRVWLVGMG